MACEDVNTAVMEISSYILQVLTPKEMKLLPEEICFFSLNEKGTKTLYKYSPHAAYVANMLIHGYLFHA